MYNAYVIAGGTGLIGTALTKMLLNLGERVYILTRSARKSDNPQLNYIQWQPATNTIEQSITESNVCIINLSGTNVASGRWTNKRKLEILNSRTQSIKALAAIIAEGKIKPTHIVSASAIGYYGSPGVICTEDLPASDDFLGKTCQEWEQANVAFTQLGISTTILRIGLVMSCQGGALPELMNSLMFKIAGVPANGKQIYSWIHIDDLCQIFYYVLEHKLSGVYNAVAPKPSTAKDLITAMAKANGGGFITLNIPTIALKIALGEFAIELLKSTEVSAQKLLDSGFQFKYADVTSCMNNLLAKKTTV